MGIDPELVRKLSRRSEVKAARVFSELGYAVTEIPRGVEDSPDLLVSDAAGPFCLVEVKSLFSGGSHEDGTLHSLLDPGMWNGQTRSVPLTTTKADANFSKAANQYRAAVRQRPEWADLPFIVAFYDNHGSGGNQVPRDGMTLFPEISAAVREAQDWDFLDAFWAEPIEKRDWRERVGNWEGLPKRKRRWRILHNPAARIPVPPSLVERSIVWTGSDLGIPG